MTLVAWVLNTIKTNWDGSFPSDLERINRDDTQNLTAGRRARTVELKKANVVHASFAETDDNPFGVQSDPQLEAIVNVQVEGLHTDEYGHTDDEANFRDLVRSIKATLRDERFSPAVGSEHPATFVRLELDPEQSVSGTQADYFGTQFDVRLRGHR